MKLTDKEVNDFIKKNWLKMSNSELAKKMGLTIGAIRHRAYKMKLANKNKQEKEYNVDEELESTKKKREEINLKQKYDLLLKQYQAKIEELHSVKEVPPINTFEIPEV